MHTQLRAMSGLSRLALISGEQTRSISPENPTGKKGGGAKATPGHNHPAADLGKGWKARPYIKLPAGSTTELMDLKGEGIIRHIWMTIDEVEAHRGCTLRFYWNGEDAPSIEVPLGDFFANCHKLRYPVNSLPVAVNPTGGLNCYWPMPFARRAKITLENKTESTFDQLYYQITYSLTTIPDEVGHFHARWRQSKTSKKNPSHVILPEVDGQGNYVGTVLGWTQFSRGWWGEGELKFYLDGDRDYPTLCYTGTEDYFGGAWGFGSSYMTPFQGYPLAGRGIRRPQHAMYRWHVLDPIRFHENIRVTVQALQLSKGKYKPLADRVASVAYWYQQKNER